MMGTMSGAISATVANGDAAGAPPSAVLPSPERARFTAGGAASPSYPPAMPPPLIPLLLLPPPWLLPCPQPPPPKPPPPKPPPLLAAAIVASTGMPDLLLQEFYKTGAL